MSMSLFHANECTKSCILLLNQFDEAFNKHALVKVSWIRRLKNLCGSADVVSRTNRRICYADLESLDTKGLPLYRGQTLG